MDVPTPLSSIKVLDMGHWAVGPWAGMLLGGLGATVIKLESPGEGDKMRSQMPLQGAYSPGYAHCNLNKSNIVLDLKSSQGQRDAHSLIRESDVFIENLRPGTAARLGMGYEDLASINSRLVYASSCGWGWSGQLSRLGGVDMTAQAFSGWTSISGQPGETGQLDRVYGSLDLLTGCFLAAGILDALSRREVSGIGALVQVTQVEASLAIQMLHVNYYYSTGQQPMPLGSACRFTAPHEAFVCSDKKHIAIGVVNDSQWSRLCRVLDIPELKNDARFANNNRRVENRDALRARIAPVFEGKPSRWWEIRLAQEEVPHALFLDFQALMYHQQALENGYLSPVEIPDMGSLYVGGIPIKFNSHPLPIHPSEGPGEHTDVVRRRGFAGVSDGTNQNEQDAFDTSITARNDEHDGPIRVLDLSQGISGPYSSLLLAETGADVTKVEPSGGDYARRFWPPEDDSSLIFTTLNRGKKMVSIDWSSQRERDRIRELIRQADVVIFDWDSPDLGPIRPRSGKRATITCRISGFGEKGPWAGRPSSELVAQAAAGYCAGLGRIGAPPIRVGADIASLATGLFAFIGIQSAIFQRARTGMANELEVSLFGTLIHLHGILWSYQSSPSDWFGFYCDSATKPEDRGYRTKDGRIYFTCMRTNLNGFHSLLRELGLEKQMADRRFSEEPWETVAQGRYAHEVKDVWEAALQERESAELAEIIERHGGEALPLNDYASLFSHPQMEHLPTFQHSDPGARREVVIPWVLSHEPP
jgi:crotonobetainyl-CoA:carnitine CoA-transferase CaiB-like acyl-CoA transferase